MKKNTKIHGYTLIEMVIVIMLIAILSPIAATILTQQFQIFATGQDFANADWQARTGLDRMTKDIRAATKLINAENNTITFETLNGETITYNLGGINNKQLIYTTSTTSQPLADNINSITFSYFDKDGNISTNDASYIRINTNVLNRSVNFNIITLVLLWNIKN